MSEVVAAKESRASRPDGQFVDEPRSHRNVARAFRSDDDALAIKVDPRADAPLVAAIREVATEPRHHKLADRAATGEFGDYADTHVFAITELHRLCRQWGLHALADRVADGEFDASKDEGDEWARSPSGQAAARELSPEMRDVIGIKLNN